MKLSDLHIRRQEDRSYAAIWGPFLLRSGFQPIFRMDGGPTRITAFEALCRPFRDEKVLSPAQFFPLVAQQDAYRVELQTRSVHILNAPTVLTDKEWLFLNFDPSLLTTPQSVTTAISVLEETLDIAEIARNRVVCEVTEHRTDESNLIALVEQLREGGYKIAVDDYGADDSDLDRVRKLRPDIVKFDAYWITKMMDSGSAGTELLKDMVQAFKARDIQTLFEGIEQSWQLDLAVECGVEYVQGFTLSKPQTAPADFHAFRAKQKMSAPIASNAIKPNNGVGTNGFLAWDREMAASMEAPSYGASYGSGDVSNQAPARLPSYADFAEDGPLPSGVRYAAPGGAQTHAPQPSQNRAPSPAPQRPQQHGYTPPPAFQPGAFRPVAGQPRGGTFGRRS
jgi:EAL domain-containing protein (putative c-di-GMP-specific phosphodiesterase class I)